MQEANVIRPSKSPLASPVVLVKKKDGMLRFCADYRKLNQLTKADTFPLPKIDDLLDQLGNSKYFNTLDLKSGYWQIKDHPSSQKKAAFTTHQGLFEFWVMPFGLMNAPAAFQRLMQQILMGFNTERATDFVVVYLDDINFSETFQEHITYLRTVLQRMEQVNPKLNPKKCCFGCQVVVYLGRILTPDGLKPNPERIAAVRKFATPHDVKAVKQFLGLASFYREFVPNFARIAEPLHNLNNLFEWTATCQNSFNCLKKKLVKGPVLVYPDFTKDFVLKTDASIHSLGAVLSQVQEDKNCHPVSYASQALTPRECNYAITELETLTVVWPMGHFHKYLYGHNITVFTDHTAVKAVLQNPSPSSKHAQWWTKVHGSGVKDIRIIYRPGKENLNADALSRQPYLPAPSEGVAEGEIQVCALLGETDIESFLKMDSDNNTTTDFSQEQKKDTQVSDIFCFLQDGQLPTKEKRAKKVLIQQDLFAIVDNILY